MQAVENASLEHPSSNQVQELEQQEEEARREIERLTPIFGQFQQTVGSTEQSVPEDVQEEENEDEEEKEDEEDQEEQHEEELEQTKEKPLEVDSLDDANEEII